MNNSWDRPTLPFLYTTSFNFAFCFVNRRIHDWHLPTLHVEITISLYDSFLWYNRARKVRHRLSGVLKLTKLLCSGWYLLLLLLLFAILRNEREVIPNVLLASGNSIHSSCHESEHEADDYDDDEEDDRQERNLPYDTKINFDNYFLCHNMPITLFHSLILCR